MVAQLETVKLNSDSRLSHQIEGLLQVFAGAQRSFFTGVIAQALAIAAHGTPVLVVQFLKGGIRQGRDCSVRMAQNLDWWRCDLSRNIDSSEMTVAEREAVLQLWTQARQAIEAGRYTLVILDELVLAAELGAIPLADVIAFLEHRPQHIDTILTGPQMPAEILAMADQVTEVRRTYLP